MAGLSVIGSGQSVKMIMAAIMLFCLAVRWRRRLYNMRRRRKTDYRFCRVEGQAFMAANVFNFVYGVAIIGVMSLSRPTPFSFII